MFNTFCHLPFSDVWLLLATGHNATAIDEVEVISLDPDNYPVPLSLRFLQPYPVINWGSASARLKDGPVVCGGHRYNAEDSFIGHC